MATEHKPTVEDLGIDLSAQQWLRSGSGAQAIEVAFPVARGEQWVLMRVAGDPDERVLVYDRHEWDCFVDGAKRGEFDDASGKGDGATDQSDGATGQSDEATGRS